MRGAEVGGLASRQLKNNTTTASPEKTVAMARVVSLVRTWANSPMSRDFDLEVCRIGRCR